MDRSFAPTIFRDHQRHRRVPDGRSCKRCRTRISGISAGMLSQRPCLQSACCFPTPHRLRPGKCDDARGLRGGCDPRQQLGRADASSDGSGSGTRQDYGGALPIHRKLVPAASMDDVLWATAHQVALMLRVRVVMLLPGLEGWPCRLDPYLRIRCTTRNSRPPKGLGTVIALPGAAPIPFLAARGCSCPCRPLAGPPVCSASTAISRG
jgi:hypothetical protein